MTLLCPPLLTIETLLPLQFEYHYHSQKSALAEAPLTAIRGSPVSHLLEARRLMMSLRLQIPLLKQGIPPHPHREVKRRRSTGLLHDELAPLAILLLQLLLIPPLNHHPVYHR